MNIIIVGAGKVGLELTRLLSGEGHDITVIDTASKAVETAVNDFDVFGYLGNGASFPVQEEAGADRCDIFIAVTGSDELNIMSCMVAGKIGAKRTVARVRNTDYSEQLLFMQSKLGIDLLINPELETAADIARTVQFPSATKIETFAKGRIDLAEITVTPDSPLSGVALYDIRKRFGVTLLICAVQRGDEVLIPSGGYVIQPGDRIHFTAAKNQLPGIFKAIGMQKKRIRSVLIVGGSRTAFYLARYLLAQGKKVKIIERDRERAAMLEGMLEGAAVVCGDGTDPEILAEERLSDFDATVGLTQIDEENIIFSMYASKQGVSKTACKVNREPLAKMTADLLSDCSIVCPKQQTADMILRYVRAIGNAGSGMQTLYKILDGKAEAIEFIAPADSPVCGIPLKELDIKKNILIACVSRGREVLVPGGDTVILPSDSVIVITAGESISTLAEILE